MDTKFCLFLICVAFFTIGQGLRAAGSEPSATDSAPGQKPIVVRTQEEGPEKEYNVGSSKRLERIYPSNWGQAGIFRVRSAESLPEHALTFGVGGEFYSTTDAPRFTGTSETKTIAESIFVGYSPVERLSLGVMRRSSSTTYGNPQQLISSLGDLNLSALYSFAVTESLALAPIVNFLVASNFNQLNPTGNTLSGGVGMAATFSFFKSFELPLFIHGNLFYHSPQISTSKTGPLEPEAFFNFSRYHTVSLGLGAEYALGDFIPFVEYYDTVQASSGLSFGSSPSKISVGTRITPISNKSLAFLLGADVGIGRGQMSGVPYTPPYQVLGQVSYTVGLTQTERKHYVTSQDVNIVDRKFILQKQVRFKTNSAELDPASASLLDQIASVIKDNDVKKLLIVGHTDSTASEGYNTKLSLARAQSVKAYLVSKGVSEETLLTQGYGKRKPIASNLTEEGRSLNRRVEFYILE